jgi:PAS domain S-box-containing protein
VPGASFVHREEARPEFAVIPTPTSPPHAMALASRALAARAAEGRLSEAELPRQVLQSASCRDDSFLASSAFALLLGSALTALWMSRKARAAHRQARLLRAVLDSLPDGVIACDAQGRVTLLNSACEALIGWRAAEALGQPSARLLAGVDERTPERAAAALGQAAPGCGAPTVHEVLLTRGGRDLPIECRAAPTTDGSGSVLLLRDVSAQRRALERLRDSEEQLRLLVDDVQDYSIIRLAADGTVASWNAGSERLLGYRAEEILGQHVSRFYDPEEVREGLPARELARAEAAGRAEDESWRVRKDGSRFWANSLTTALRDPSGRLRGFGSVTRDFTDRQRVVEELRSSEERLNRAQQIAHLGSWDIDRVNGRVTWSSETYRILGHEPGEVRPSYQTFLDCVHSADRAKFDAAHAQSMRDESVGFDFEHRILLKSGEVRDLHAKCEHIRDAGGRIVRSFGMIHDITERKKTEMRISWLASFPQRDGMPIAEIDLQGCLHYLNPAAETLFPDLAQKGLAHPWFSGWDSIIESLRASDGQHERIVDLGETVYRQAISFVREVDGDERIRVYGTDVTALKRAEGHLLRSRQGLRHLVDSSLEIMRATTLESMLQVAASAAVRLTRARMAVAGHLSADSLLQVGGVAQASRAASGPAAERREAQPAAPLHSLAMEADGICARLVTGSCDTLRLTVAELRAHPRGWQLWPEQPGPGGLVGARTVDAHGRTSGMLLAFDREQGEFTEEDESLLGQLGAIVSLARQHAEARWKLEEADSRKNEFLAMLSHELRNPLAPIRNSLYILDRVAHGGEQAARAHRIIDRQTAHMTRLIDDLLDVTRISRGKIHLQCQRLELGELTRRTVEDHRSLFQQSNIRLEVHVEGSDLWVEGDETRLAQVVGNLLQNAAKFTGSGGTTTICVERDTAASQAVLRMRDTGAGLSAEMLPRLFEPFVQADRTLDRSRGGLGLGLALVKSLVELHGGSVEATSRGIGTGAEFTVRLPIPPPENPGPAAKAPAAQGPCPRRRVLVIEDNIDAAESLKEALELGDHEVSVAHNGFEGIQRARELKPDVVLCDIGLPGADGYSVARAFRSDATLRSAFLVALTGYAGPEDQQRAAEAGFQGHLAKPATLEKLERVLLLARNRPDALAGERHRTD